MITLWLHSNSPLWKCKDQILFFIPQKGHIGNTTHNLQIRSSSEDQINYCYWKRSSIYLDWSKQSLQWYVHLSLFNWIERIIWPASNYNALFVSPQAPSERVKTHQRFQCECIRFNAFVIWIWIWSTVTSLFSPFHPVLIQYIYTVYLIYSFNDKSNFFPKNNLICGQIFLGLWTENHKL